MLCFYLLKPQHPHHSIIHREDSNLLKTYIRNIGKAREYYEQHYVIKSNNLDEMKNSLADTNY